MESWGDNEDIEMVQVEPVSGLDYDGELVVMADAEFSDKNPFNVVVVDRVSGRVFETNDAVCELLRRHHDIRTPPASGRHSVAKRELLEMRAAASFSRVNRDLDEDVIDLLLEGKIRVASLIDSDGGDMDVLRNYQRALEYLTVNGGKSEAFVVGHSGSAAFELMASSQNIYLMLKTALLWHFSDIHGERRSAVQDLKHARQIPRDKEKELMELFDFLSRSDGFNSVVRGRYLAEITHGGNPEGELGFSGGELLAMGLVRQAYMRIGNMRRCFENRYYACESSRVREFWGLSTLLVREAGDFDEWDSFNFEERRKEMRKKVGHIWPVTPPNKVS